MSMKHVKATVDQFSTRTFQVGELTFGEVLRGRKVLCSLAQGNDKTVLYSWPGKAPNPEGKRFYAQRTTRSGQFEKNFEVELSRGLHRAVAAALMEDANSMF